MWGSSRTRARTRVPCIGRRILNHCVTREALWVLFTSLSLNAGEAQGSVLWPPLFSLGSLARSSVHSRDFKYTDNVLIGIPNPSLLPELQAQHLSNNLLNISKWTNNKQYNKNMIKTDSLISPSNLLFQCSPPQYRTTPFFKLCRLKLLASLW